MTGEYEKVGAHKVRPFLRICLRSAFVIVNINRNLMSGAKVNRVCPINSTQ